MYALTNIVGLCAGFTLLLTFLKVKNDIKRRSCLGVGHA